MRKNRRRFCRILALFLVLLLLLSLPALFSLRKRLRSAASDHARLLTETILTEAAAQCAREGLFSYEALMHLRYGPSGELLSLSPDAAMLHLLCEDYLRRVNALLKDSAYAKTSFPLGSVLGSDLFSAWGPPVSLQLHSRHTLRIQSSHSWEEAGINQSLHTVSLCVEGSVTVLLSSGELSLTIRRELPVCQTLLMGKVPSWHLPT